MVVDPKEREQALRAIRKICLGLPETSERLSHGAPSFFVKDKRCFVMVLTDHHGDGRFAIWCAAGEGVQGMLIEADPERFFRPPYVGGRGWLGVRLDRGLDLGRAGRDPRGRVRRGGVRRSSWKRRGSAQTEARSSQGRGFAGRSRLACCGSGVAGGGSRRLSSCPRSTGSPS